ncbi:RNA polymerase II subunit A C-terminal domain phosphatase-like [Ptychodera flava]|uniref:RNA polymerase II subunit A C-terminal domain phosphatase-like n=1 Tax=Ptychodera flava TaxID=63121 RepID=UPI00396A03E2
MATPLKTVCLPGTISCRIAKWKVKPGSTISQGSVLALYETVNSENGDNRPVEKLKLKSNEAGTVQELVAKEGQTITPGTVLMYLEGCTHPTVMKDMCAECGADLRVTDGHPGERLQPSTASVAMVHSVPELQVSQEQAIQLAMADEQRLLKSRKLVCIVDLDQTIIHTTMDNVPQNLKDVHHFQLWPGPQYPWFHTRVRPRCKAFLEKISKLYELHIFTFGARLYAHMIAGCIDPDKKLFSHRILSRDECFDPNSKTANLKSIFPCGDNLVCIIDDREDVWNFAPNMVHVKPYHYFEGTGDINSPTPAKDIEQAMPGKTKMPKEGDTPSIPDNNNVKGQEDVVCEKNEESSESDKDKEEEAEEEKESVSETREDENGNSGKEGGDADNQENVETEKTEKTEEITKMDSQKEGESKMDDNTVSPSSEKTDKNGVTGEKNEKGDSKVDVDKDENDFAPDQDDDDYLYYLEDILERIHHKFYEIHDSLQKKQMDSIEAEVPDLKMIIPSIRKKVLIGTNILFTGVFPTNMPPEKSRAWKVAKALGANVQTAFVAKGKDSKNLANATTHVVAANAGTAKVKQAQYSKGVHIVTPEWLWCCYERWERVDERLFKLFIPKPTSSSSSSRSSSPPLKVQEPKAEKPQEPPSLPVYDPVTGKRVRKTINQSTDQTKQPSLSAGPPRTGLKRPGQQDDNSQDRDMLQRMYRRQPSISETINPLYSFSSEELEDMDKEVEDIFGDSDSERERESESSPSSDPETLGSTTKPPSSSSEESLSGEHPRGWRKKRRRRATDEEEDENLMSAKCARLQRDSSSSAGLSEEDVSSDEDKMAAAIDDLLTYSKKL